MLLGGIIYSQGINRPIVTDNIEIVDTDTWEVQEFSRLLPEPRFEHGCNTAEVGGQEMVIVAGS